MKSLFSRSSKKPAEETADKNSPKPAASTVVPGKQQPVPDAAASPVQKPAQAPNAKVVAPVAAAAAQNKNDNAKSVAPVVTSNKNDNAKAAAPAKDNAAKNNNAKSQPVVAAAKVQAPGKNTQPAAKAQVPNAAKPQPKVTSALLTSGSNVSADILWGVVRNQSSFLVKRQFGREKAQFSRERGNLMNVNSIKYSGLVHQQVNYWIQTRGNFKTTHVQTIDIQESKKGGVDITLKRKAFGQKPSKQNATTTFNPSKGTRRVAKTVKGLAKNGYRSELEHAALARTSALISAQKKGKRAQKVHRGKFVRKSVVVKSSAVVPVAKPVAVAKPASAVAAKK